LWAELYSPSAYHTNGMMRSALAVLAFVQIVDAQDLFIPARQLRGSANASLDNPSETMATMAASVAEPPETPETRPEEEILPNMTVSAEWYAWWGHICKDSRGSVGGWKVCDFRGRGLDGHRKLGVEAKFWSDDDLRFHLKVGHMEPGRGCVFQGKVVPDRYWNYRGNNWKTIWSERIERSDRSHFKKTCMAYRFECIRPFHGKNCGNVHVKEITIGDFWW